MRVEAVKLQQGAARFARRAAAWAAPCKPLARDAVASALALARLTRPARFARGSLTVVTFHRVLPRALLERYPLPGLAVTPLQLESICSELMRHFSCGPLIEAYRVFRDEPQRSPPRLAITFDDGALDNFEHALPVLESLGLKASFYIPVHMVEARQPPWHDRLGFALMAAAAALQAAQPAAGAVAEALPPLACSAARLKRATRSADLQRLCEAGAEAAKALAPSEREQRLAALEEALGGAQVPQWAGLMSWEQIQQLSDAGHEIGSHSMTHPLLPDCSAQQIAHEVARSRERLREVTGAAVASFCYPNGSYDRRCVQAVAEAGYECSVTTRWGRNSPSTASHELLRCDMDAKRMVDRAGRFSPDRMLLRLSGLQPGLR